MDITASDLVHSPFCRLVRPGRLPQASAHRAAAVRVVVLPMNGTFDVERPYGCGIQCVRGSLWITHIGDGRDVVVEAGSSFIGDRDRPMFVQALTPAEFVVARVDEPVTQQTLQPRKEVLYEVLDWLASTFFTAGFGSK